MFFSFISLKNLKGFSFPIRYHTVSVPFAEEHFLQVAHDNVNHTCEHVSDVCVCVCISAAMNTMCLIALIRDWWIDRLGKCWKSTSFSFTLSFSLDLKMFAAVLFLKNKSGTSHVVILWSFSSVCVCSSCLFWTYHIVCLYHIWFCTKNTLGFK